MCGIISFSRAEGKTSIAKSDLFIRAGLLAIENRGRDATGAAWTTPKTEAVWYDKVPGPAGLRARALQVHTKARIDTALGHTRKATMGNPAVYDENHPVVSDTIVLVHNGRVDNADELIDLSGLDRIGTVDSWALPALISEADRLAADHPTDLLELVHGVAAVAWIDSSDRETLHLARLSTRPMSITWTRRGDLLMASTRTALQRWARSARIATGDPVDVAEGTYLAVQGGEIVDYRTFAVNHPPAETVIPASVGRAKHVRRRSPMHGITDAVEQGKDWWDETERLLDMTREEIDAEAEAMADPAVEVMDHDEFLRRTDR